MIDKKNRWVVILVCVNVFLLTAVILSQVGIPKAYGQVRPYDYMLIPGRLDMDSEAVWILDMRNHQLTTCRYNKNTGQIEVGQVVEVGVDLPWNY